MPPASALSESYNARKRDAVKGGSGQDYRNAPEPGARAELAGAIGAYA